MWHFTHGGGLPQLPLTRQKFFAKEKQPADFTVTFENSFQVIQAIHVFAQSPRVSHSLPLLAEEDPDKLCSYSTKQQARVEL